MSRISYQRTTPEGWQQTVRRMVLLNDLQIEPEDAREAIAYLATHHAWPPRKPRKARSIRSAATTSTTTTRPTRRRRSPATAATRWGGC